MPADLPSVKTENETQDIPERLKDKRDFAVISGLLFVSPAPEVKQNPDSQSTNHASVN